MLLLLLLLLLLEQKLLLPLLFLLRCCLPLLLLQQRRIAPSRLEWLLLECRVGAGKDGAERMERSPVLQLDGQLVVEIARL